MILSIVPCTRDIFPESDLDSALFWDLVACLGGKDEGDGDIFDRTIDRLEPSRAGRSARYQALRASFRVKRRMTGVYFIQSGADGPIKIGYATNIAARFGELQVGNPNKLHLLGATAGFRETERRLHALYAAFSLRGEWFHPDSELRRFIREVAE